MVALAQQGIGVRVRTVRDKHTNRVLGQVVRGLRPAQKRALMREGLALMKTIREGIRSQAPGGKTFKPLAASTIALRKVKRGKASTKALIDNADLLRSVNVTEMHMGAVTTSVFVGVHRKARSKAGKKMANIAEIQEFGTKPYTIPVTHKMRAWWNAMAKRGVFRGSLPKTTTVLRHPGIPPRPFLQPSYDLWKKGASQRYFAWVLRELGFMRLWGRGTLRGFMRFRKPKAPRWMDPGKVTVR